MIQNVNHFIFVNKFNWAVLRNSIRAQSRAHVCVFVCVCSCENGSKRQNIPILHHLIHTPSKFCYIRSCLWALKICAYKRRGNNNNRKNVVWRKIIDKIEFRWQIIWYMIPVPKYVAEVFKSTNSHIKWLPNQSHAISKKKREEVDTRFEKCDGKCLSNSCNE